MTEPTTPTAIGAGTAMAFFALLGVEPAPLFWALVGACIGMSFAGTMNRFRAAIVFICVVLVCSLFGAWLSVRYFEGERISRNALACGLAIFFHPLLSAAITKLPAAIDAGLRRIGLGSHP